MQKGSVVQRFSYDAQGKVVAVDYSTNGGSSYTTYYYLRNAQGDIVKLIDGNRNTVVEYTYDSWGKILAVTGSLATSLGSNQPFRYRGYVYDTETQWYYLQSRYYDPNTCRFISSDVYLSTGQGVIGHNSYAYCLNTPVNGHDSNGQAFRPYSVGMTDGGSEVRFDSLASAVHYFKKSTERWKNTGRIYYANIYIHRGALKDKDNATIDSFKGKSLVELEDLFEHNYTVKTGVTIDSWGGVTWGNMKLDGNSNAFVLWKPKNIGASFITHAMNYVFIIELDGSITQIKEGAKYSCVI